MPYTSRVFVEFSSQLSISLCNFIFMRALLQKDFFVALSKWAWKRNCHIIWLIFVMRTKNNFRPSILISSGTLQQLNKHRRWPMSGVALIKIIIGPVSKTNRHQEERSPTNQGIACFKIPWPTFIFSGAKDIFSSTLPHNCAWYEKVSFTCSLEGCLSYVPACIAFHCSHLYVYH